MDRLKTWLGACRPLVVGILAGGLGILVGGLGLIALEYYTSVPQAANPPSAPRKHDLSENLAVPEDVIKQRNWVRDDLYEQPVHWAYMRIDEDGWSVTTVSNLLQLKERLSTTERDILIPVFPTVYEPNSKDRLYYDAIFKSGIERGDKVLVIGSGSGSDAWVAWLKSQSRVYVIEINPMAVANIKTTARIGAFPVSVIVGDVREVTLPKDFGDFDFVLWNMPYVYPEEKGGKLQERNFHDGDDGSIITGFLKRLPSLLKKDGQVILLNTDSAMEYIKFPNVTTKAEGNVLVYTFSAHAD